MVADVERAHARRDGLDQLRVAVAEVVGAAVQVHVDQPQARHVPDEVALAPVDDQVDAASRSRSRSCPGSRTPCDFVQDLGLGLDAEDVVVVHRPAFVRSGRQRAPPCAASQAGPSPPCRNPGHTRPNHVSVRPNSQEPLSNSGKPKTYCQSQFGMLRSGPARRSQCRSCADERCRSRQPAHRPAGTCHLFGVVEEGNVRSSWSDQTHSVAASPIGPGQPPVAPTPATADASVSSHHVAAPPGSAAGPVHRPVPWRRVTRARTHEAKP